MHAIGVGKEKKIIMNSLFGKVSMEFTFQL